MRSKSSKKVVDLLQKSERGLRAAKRLMADGDHDFSVSRAYYAMFHAAQALLLEKGLTASTHGGLLTLFYQHFVKSGIIPKELHQDLHRAMDLRQQGDYWSDSGISKEMAGELVETAGQFILMIKKKITSV